MLLTSVVLAAAASSHQPQLVHAVQQQPRHAGAAWPISTMSQGTRLSDAALEQLQSESEALVGKLEAAIGVLRREKEDVEHSLPGMKETLLYVELTNLQKMCYRAVLDRTARYYGRM